MPNSCAVDVFGNGTSIVVVSQPSPDAGSVPWGCLDAVGELTALAYEGKGVRFTQPQSMEEAPIRRQAACAALRKRFGAVVFIVDGGVPVWVLEKVTHSFGWSLEHLSSYRHGTDVTPSTPMDGGGADGGAAGVSGVFYVPPGEGSKSRDMKASIEDWMLQLGSYQSPRHSEDGDAIPFHCGRDTLMVAVGGGVVGDLAGFVASTFMRGVDVVQVPTTLMAMVDSSVGGKTAINIPGIGKNLIGSFHQPRLIAMDVRCLTTLPHRVLVEAVGEVIKYEMIGVTHTPGGDTVAGIVGSRYTALLGGDAVGDSRRDQLLQSPLAVSGLIPLEGLFAACQPSNTDPPAAHTASCLPLWFGIVLLSVLSKQYFVAGDANEVKGLREVLNFGHTVGHAIEGCASEGKGSEGLLHGECVAAGMVHEVELALMIPPTDSTTTVLPTTFISLWRLRWILQRCGLPASIEECRRRIATSLPVDALEKYMLQDKKNRGGKVHVVLLGQCRSSAVPLTTVRTVCGSDYHMDTSMPNTIADRDVPMVGSKSITNRALILGAQLPLIGGRLGGVSDVILEDALLSDDTLLLYCALVELGLVSRRDHPKGLAFSTHTSIPAIRPTSRPVDPISVYVGNSGTTARFLLGLLVFTHPSRIKGISTQVLLHGTSRMHERPIGDLVDALRVGLTTLLAHSAPTIEYMGREGCLPVKITLAPTMSFIEEGSNGTVRLAVNSTQSSQFQSSLLLATPTLLNRVPAGVCVVVEGGGEVGQDGTPTVVSGGYIHMSAHMLGQFGVPVRAVTDEERCGSSLRLAYEVRLPTGQYTPQPTTFTYPVEPDMSASSNFHALAGGRCLLDGSAVVVDKCVHLQSDSDFPSIVVAPILHTIRSGGCLTLDMEAYTDSFIAASALTVFGGLWCTYGCPIVRNDWSITLVNIANQRVKECDRLAATVKELGKVCSVVGGGRVSISELPDGVHIVFRSSAPISSIPTPLSTCHIDTYDDHRVAMAAAVMGVLYGCLPNAPFLPIVIRDFRCVEKTFPSFFNFI